MGPYFARRLLLMIPTIIGVTFLVFSITRFVPGGPVDRAMMQLQGGLAAGGEAGGGGEALSSVEIKEEYLAELKAHYDLDKPLPVAYGKWLGRVSRLDLGKSQKFNRPVADIIWERLDVSLYFGLIGFVLAYLVSIPLGVAKAIRHGGLFDFGSSALVFAGYSIPGWALGLLLLLLFGAQLEWVPLGGFRSEGWEEFGFLHKIADQVQHTILPVLAYAAGSFATLTILTKNSLMENLGADYVRTAYAKGLGEKRVIFGHALRNSLIPIATGLGHAISIVMAGSFLVERVFNIDGIGKLGYTSIIERDYFMVMGILLINTVLVLVGNMLSDFLYTVVDPRIRFQ